MQISKNNNVKHDFSCWETEQLIDCLPQNRPLYKDSGRWQIRSDNMENVYMLQHANESFRNFIIRYIEWLNEHGEADDIMIDLACLKTSLF